MQKPFVKKTLFFWIVLFVKQTDLFSILSSFNVGGIQIKSSPQISDFIPLHKPELFLLICHIKS